MKLAVAESCTLSRIKRNMRVGDCVARFSVGVGLLFLVAIQTSAQKLGPVRQPEAQDDSEPAAYDITSVRPSLPGGSSSGRTDDDGIDFSGMTIKNLISNAYDAHTVDEVLGLPDWAKVDRFDVKARMDESAMAVLNKHSKDERMFIRRKMLRALLASRFQLRVHQETRDMPTYVMTVSKTGPKFRTSQPSEITAMQMSFGVTRNVSYQAMTMDSLATNLSSFAGRLVVNKTNLPDTYDFKLTWVADDGGGSSMQGGTGPLEADAGPPILTAVEEQLGLKLKLVKGPVPVVVVDKVERPSEN